MVCLKEENTKALQDASTALKAAMEGFSFPTGTGTNNSTNKCKSEHPIFGEEGKKINPKSNKPFLEAYTTQWKFNPVARRILVDEMVKAGLLTKDKPLCPPFIITPSELLNLGNSGSAPLGPSTTTATRPVVLAASVQQRKPVYDVTAKRRAAWTEKGQAEWDAIKEAYLQELNAKTNTEWLTEEARRKAIINSNKSHKDNYGFKPSPKNTRPKNSWISSWKQEKEKEWKEQWLNKWQAAEVEKALQKEQKEVIRPIVDLELLLISLKKEGNQKEIKKVTEELAKARAKAASNKREKLEQAEKEYLRKKEAVKVIQQRKEKALTQQNIKIAERELLIGKAEEKVLDIKYELLKEELSEKPDRKKLGTLQEELKKLRPPVKGGTRRNRRNRRRTRRN